MNRLPFRKKKRSQRKNSNIESSEFSFVDQICYFDFLPNEILLRIFHHFTSRELVNISFVCKRWAQMTLDGSLWKECCRKELNCRPPPGVSTDLFSHFKSILLFEHDNSLKYTASPFMLETNLNKTEHSLCMEIKTLVNNNNNYGSFPQVIKHMIDHGTDVNKRTVTGSSSLHIAAEVGSVDLVEYLINVGGADVNLVNITGDSPLHFACRKGNLPVVIRLVQLGADVSLQNSFFTTPLIRAAKDNQFEIVKWLVENTDVDINHKNKWQETALIASAKRSHWPIAEYLYSQENCLIFDLEQELIDKIKNKTVN